MVGAGCCERYNLVGHVQTSYDKSDEYASSRILRMKSTLGLVPGCISLRRLRRMS